MARPHAGTMLLPSRAQARYSAGANRTKGESAMGNRDKQRKEPKKPKQPKKPTPPIHA